MNDVKASIRRQLEFRGRVQGVGFRATTQGVAASFQVTGFVQNLSGGGVRLVVEGAPDEVSRFVSAVQTRLGRYILGCESVDLPATGKFAGFSIERDGI